MLSANLSRETPRVLSGVTRYLHELFDRTHWYPHKNMMATLPNGKTLLYVRVNPRTLTTGNLSAATIKLNTTQGTQMLSFTLPPLDTHHEIAAH